MNSLSLPRIGADIPPQLVPLHEHRREAELALYFAKSGVLRGKSLPDRWDSPLQAIESTLQRWLGEQLGALQCLAPAFSLELGGRYDGEGEDLIATCYATSAPVWHIGPGAARLEQLAPGLGATAIALLYGQWTYPLFTPVHAFEEASYLCWQGGDDEQDALKECTNDEQRADLLESIVTRAQFDAAYPAWVSHPDDAQLSMRALVRLAKEGGPAAPHAAQLRRLKSAQLRLTARQRQAYASAEAPLNDDEDGDYGSFAGYGGKLIWHEDDPTLRLFDMQDHLTLQGDCHDWISRSRCSLDHPAQLGQWYRQLQLHLQVMRQLDALLAGLLA
ncbi:PRTRC system protein F [Rugamonas aquatica]|uniref:PRTRC system protein F n=1 Tax=Rugamonas aquatica TaxID=2743357 RepID=A0A6A7N6N3_9BURK|nr:PRTRC system protein F [Rugamonas aquatica]MQA40568.1 PRTRC system protein F [Rugamonas aquatica]